MKILFFVLGTGLILAGCTDKAAETKMAEMEKDMHVKDSTCMANTQMLMDSIMTMREEMLMLNQVGTSTTTTTKTTVTPKTTTTTPDKKIEVGTKEGTTNKKIDIKKKGGTTSGGGM